MNYIKEINSFYDWLETNQLTTSCIVLWFALMNIANKAGWPDKFAVAVSVLEVKTGLKRDAIYDARNKLQQVGRIRWESRKGNQCAVYQFMQFVSDTAIQNPTQNNINGNASDKPTQEPTQTPTQTPTQEPTQTPTINKLNNTKQKEYIPIKEIIDYLNLMASTRYRYNTEETVKCITKRCKDGYKLDDFKKVIDNKCSQWLGTDQEQYLRPETLFGKKFEGYLNQRIPNKQPLTGDNIPNAAAYKNEKGKCPCCHDTWFILDEQGNPMLDDEGHLIRCDKCKKGGK
jgi:uncharacterized phage protein (TIGR02220 family)